MQNQTASNGATKKQLKMAAYKQELIRIEKTEGTITPEKFIELAKPAGSLFHNLLEWNNEKAGHQWRLQRARELIIYIRHYVIVETVDLGSYNDIDRSKNLTVHDPKLGNRRQGYASLRNVVKGTKADARAVLDRQFATINGHLETAQESAARMHISSYFDKKFAELVAKYGGVTLLT